MDACSWALPSFPPLGGGEGVFMVARWSAWVGLWGQWSGRARVYYRFSAASVASLMAFLNFAVRWYVKPLSVKVTSMGNFFKSLLGLAFLGSCTCATL